MNKQQLSEVIINNAPEDATHYGHYGDNSVYYLMCGDSGYYSLHKGKWSRLSGIGGTFIWSLSDLQTQLNQLNEIERLGAVLSDMVRTSEGGLGHFYSIDEFYKARADADQLLKELNK